MGQVLVAIDGSPLSRAAAEMALLLAEPLGASVEGLYVEDPILARMADHPAVTVMSLSRGRPHGDGRLIGAALKRRRQAAGLCLPDRPFTIRQGPVLAEMLEAAAAAEILALGWHSQHIGPLPPRFGALAGALIEACPTPLLLVRHLPTARPSLAVLLDDPSALTLAQRLAGSEPVIQLRRPQDAQPYQLLLISKRPGLERLGCSLLVTNP